MVVEFWTLVVDIGIVMIGPCMAIAALLQDSVIKASSVKDKKEASILVKILGVLMLYGLCLWDFNMYKEIWQYIFDIPNKISKGAGYGIIVFAFIVMWASFYYMIYLIKGRMVVFYRYRVIRWIIFGAQIADSIMIIGFLLMVNVKVGIDYSFWRMGLLVNFSLMVLFIVVDAIRIGYEKRGYCFEYNNIIRQKKIFKLNGNKLEMRTEKNEYIVTNGAEEIRMDRLTQYQVSGINEFMNIIKG